jgi:hypothetical protein
MHCGQAHRLGERHGQALLRALHGLVDLGGQGEGLNGLRYLPLGSRNPHRDRLRAEQVELVVPGEGAGLRFLLKMALGHPRCEGCGAPASLDRRPALRAAGGLRCPSCRAETRPHVWVNQYAHLVPVRAVLEETEEQDTQEDYRAQQQRKVAAWWVLLEGPSRQRFDLEREREQTQAQGSFSRPSTGSFSWAYLASGLAGMAAMTALQPPAWVAAQRHPSVRFLALVVVCGWLGGLAAWANGAFARRR